MGNKKRSSAAAVLTLSFLIMSCGAGLKIPLDPQSKEFYEVARLIMTKQEKDIFRHLPDRNSRLEFIQDFWAKRDPKPDTEENEFKEEFFRRISYANQHFHEGVSGWKTDRGRIYIYLGKPDKIDEIFSHSDPSVKGSVIFWSYYRLNVAVKFTDKSGTGRYEFDPYAGIYGNLFEAIEKAKLGLIAKEDDFQKKFWDFDLTYDGEKKEFVVSLPVSALIFVEKEEMLVADFEFEFYVYTKKGIKIDYFKDTRYFEEKEETLLALEKIVFTFPKELEPGAYSIDVKISGKPEDLGVARKIFEIKV